MPSHQIKSFVRRSLESAWSLLRKPFVAFPENYGGRLSLWRSPLFLVAASLPALLAIFGSRWFSKIEVGPIYALDVALVLSSLLIAVAFRKKPFFDKFDLMLAGAFLLLPVFALARMPWGDLSREAFLDLYPWVVLIHGLLIALAVRRSGSLSQNALSTAVFVALWAHFAWVQLRVHGLMPLEALPDDFFWPRPDLDGTLIGVLAAAVFLRATRKPALRRWIGFGASFLIIIAAGTFSGSRAILVATILAILSITVAEGLRRREEGWWIAIRIVVAGVVLLGSSLSLVFSLNSGVLTKFTDQLVAVSENTLDQEQPQTSENPLDQGSRSGTANARWNAWETVITYTFDSPQKVLLGSGPGSDYLAKSGAAERLLGGARAAEPDASRHPHNVAIHTLGLLGLPASIFFCALVATAAVLSFRHSMQEVNHLRELAFILLLALGSAALLGVIFEAPYGAVPISWALGILLGLSFPPRVHSGPTTAKVNLVKFS